MWGGGRWYDNGYEARGGGLRTDSGCSGICVVAMVAALVAVMVSVVMVPVAVQ